MAFRIYKLIYGNVIYELNKLGYSYQLGPMIGTYQVLIINHKSVEDFVFVLSASNIVTENDKTFSCVVKIYAVPKNCVFTEDESLDDRYGVRQAVICTDTGLSSYYVDNLNKFVKLFKRNKLRYFYNAIINESEPNKNPNRRTLVKYYKQHKPAK